jgi:membrane protease YdiL (CAAX protease family)
MQSPPPHASEFRTDPIANVRLWHVLPLLLVATAIALAVIGPAPPPELEQKAQALAVAAAIVAWWRWTVADATRRAGYRAAPPRGAVLNQAARVAVCCFLVTLLWVVLKHQIGIPSLGLVEAPTLVDTKSRGELQWLSAITVGLFAPAAEELLFRGALFRKWRLSWGARNAALVSSVLFGFLHAQPITSMVFALAMVVLYTTTRTIWAPVAAHAMNNTLAVALTGAGPLLPTALLAAAADWRMQLAALVPALLGTLWLARFLGRNWHTLGAPLDGVVPPSAVASPVNA